MHASTALTRLQSEQRGKPFTSMFQVRGSASLPLRGNSHVWHAGASSGGGRGVTNVPLSPVDPSLVFLPAITSEEFFIFITGYTEAIIPCRVTNPELQVTLYEKKVENPIPAAYDPQQGFKGFFEDKTYYCQAIVDDQEVDSDTFYVYRIQGELPSSWHISVAVVAVPSKQQEWDQKDFPPSLVISLINLGAGFSPVSIK